MNVISLAAFTEESETIHEKAFCRLYLLTQILDYYSYPDTHFLVLEHYITIYVEVLLNEFR